MSIRNFSKLFQKMIIREPIQIPRQVPLRNFVSLNQNKQNQNISESSKEGSNRSEKDFTTRNTTDSQMKDKASKSFSQQTETNNPTNFGETHSRKGENPSKSREQQDHQLDFGMKYTKEHADFSLRGSKGVNDDAPNKTKRSDDILNSDKFEGSSVENLQAKSEPKDMNFGQVGSAGQSYPEKPTIKINENAQKHP